MGIFDNARTIDPAEAAIENQKLFGQGEVVHSDWSAV
jgi:hypothetical protein